MTNRLSKDRMIMKSLNHNYNWFTSNKLKFNSLSYLQDLPEHATMVQIEAQTEVFFEGSTHMAVPNATLVQL